MRELIQGNHVVNKQQIDSIKIFDYGVLFELNMGLMLVAIDIPLVIIDIQNILSGGILYRFESLRVLVLILLLIGLTYVFFIKQPKEFYKNKSYFLFTDKAIVYHHPKTYGSKKADFSMPLTEVEYVDYCIVTELHDRYARLHHLSAWQLYRKSSIGVHIGKATLFLFYAVTYIFLALPYRIWRLHKARESTDLLRQNLFIRFKNRNYFAVNIYSRKELDELVKYFSEHEIPMREKTHFIPHLQNQGWFVDKEEKWTNEFDIVEHNKIVELIKNPRAAF